MLESDLSRGLPEEGQFAHTALQVTESVCREKRQQIVDLKNAIEEQTGEFNFTRVLCGAEGSLALTPRYVMLPLWLRQKRCLLKPLIPKS